MKKIVKKESKQIQEHSTHGVFVVVFDQGILIQGSPGIGKSDLALSLIDRGHSLVADDLVLLSFSEKENMIEASAAKNAESKIYIRNLGVLELDSKHKEISSYKLNKVIWLSDEHTKESALPAVESISVLDQKLPLFRLTVGRNRPLALLVETIAKMNHPVGGVYE